MAFVNMSAKRPVVVRKGDKVVKCPLWSGMHECFGPMCLWKRIGSCPFYKKSRFQATIRKINMAK